jgi:elongation factor G
MSRNLRANPLPDVDHGDTITDFLPLEREKGITIQSAAITFSWPLKHELTDGSEPKTINLIDTPGHQDFRFEVDRCLPVLDGAVCILDAVKGVEAHTERVWGSAQQSKIPRIMYVNKLDRDGASFRRSVLEVASKLGSWPLVCQIPWWSKDDFAGVIDVIDQVGIKWSSTGTMTKFSNLEKVLLQEDPNLWAEVEKARLSLIEALSERDDELMELFMEHEKDVPSGPIKESIRRLINDGNGTVVPIVAGASLRNMGVQPLLDAVVDYLPSPQERPEVEVRSGTTKLSLSKAIEAASKQPKHGPPKQPPVGALASVFKVAHDPKRGMLSYVRVYHGILHKKDAMWNTNVHQFEKPLNMLQVAADKSLDVASLPTGHIGALTGLKNARTGDTIMTFPSHKAPESLRGLQIRPPEIPPAVAFISIETYSLTETKNLELALSNISREDPSLRWNRDDKTDQFILSGMGKLHLEIAQDRLQNYYKVEGDFGSIAVEYKESVLSTVGPVRVEYDRTVANKAGKAACSATLEPLEAHHRETLLESGFERDGNIIHISIPLPSGGEAPGFEPEVVRQQLLNGALAALARGPRRGCAVTNSVVTITYDYETDFFGPVSGAHIVNAAIHAVRDALKEAHAEKSVGLLEPFMKVLISCPESAGGNIQHDISSARGGLVLEVRDSKEEARVDGGIDVSKVYVPPDPYESVQSLRATKKGANRMLEIVAKVPLRDTLHYDENLRGITGGRHSLQMELDTFERVTGPRERALDST